MKNVMLAFLSLVNTDRNTGVILDKEYPELNADKLGNTHNTNESGLRYVLQEVQKNNEKLDHYVCFVSNAVRNYELDKYNCTHFEYIKNRMREVVNAYYDDVDHEMFMQSVPFDENSTKDISLNHVLEMVDIIKAKKAEDAEHKVTVYLDLSGGQRDANMLLLIISKMLEYEGDIVIKEVVYSNLVKNVGEVQSISEAYKLLEFNAGITEFINFGSMKSLNRYFVNTNAGKQDPCVDRLLKAMNDFTKKIKLCRYGEFLDTIHKLREAIEGFEHRYNSMSRDEKTSVHNLLHRFLGNIKKKYGMLFEKHRNTVEKDLRIIKWCYENEYVQQAMTLITERIPEYFLNEDGGILKISESARADLEQRFKEYKEEKDDKVTMNTWLLFRVMESNEKINKWNSEYNSGRNKIKMAFANLRKAKSFKKKIEEIEQQWGKYAEFVNVNIVIENLVKYKAFYDEADKQMTAPSDEKYSDIYVHDQLLQYADYRTKDLLAFWKDYSQEITAEEAFKLVGGKNYCDNRNVGNFSSVRNMMLNGNLYTEYDRDVVIELLFLYYEIKNERNAVNHAHNKEEKISHEDLMKKIKMLIEGVENIIHGRPVIL